MNDHTSSLPDLICQTPRLFYCLLTGACLLAPLSQAQEGEPNEQAMADRLEEITITGSRIMRSGMNTPTPVTAVNVEELTNMAPGNTIEGLSQLPQFLGNLTPNSPEGWFTRAGYGNLNLRGLGPNRTLTLLDGRRIISSTAFGGVDINVFPEALLQSVETVTGGASAAYGTDAVAGVVNFFLDTDYTGFKAHVQGGSTSREDADNVEGSVSFGMDIGERGHVLFSADYYELDGVFNYQGRDWYRAWGTVPDANGMLLIRPNVVSRNASFDGLIFAPGSALNGLQFQSDASVTQFQLSDTTFSPAPLPVGIPPARQSVVNGGSGDDLGSDRTALMPDVERDSMFLYADYDLTDDLTFYGQIIKGSNRTNRPNNPGGSLHGTPTAATIFQDNAFLPANIRQIMVDEGLESFTLKRMGGIDDLARDIFVWDDSEMTSITGGFKLDVASAGFFDGWSVDGYYQYGRNNRKWYQRGLRVDRIHAALDAVVDPATGATV